jgi:tRNA U34 5-methylaminomethyl-2-thiouridine-forming methyltransferase MnmC
MGTFTTNRLKFNLERKIVITADGSTTIHLPEWDEQYHSKYGAIQEAYHVFIKHGLQYVYQQDYKKISILEIGFGTGLNAFITLLEAEKLNISIDYFGVEAYPVSNEEIVQLNYSTELDAKENASLFQKMYDALKINGVLVTYSAKGSVRRAMQAVGFKVEKLPGPPGKREMLRATKRL